MSAQKKADSSGSFFICCGEKEIQKEAIVDLNKKQPDLTPVSKIYHLNINQDKKVNQITSVSRNIRYQSEQVTVGKTYSQNPVYTGNTNNQPTVLVKQEQKKEDIQRIKLHKNLSEYTGTITSGETVQTTNLQKNSENVDTVKSNYPIHQGPAVVSYISSSQSKRPKINFTYSSRPQITKSKIDQSLNVASLHNQELQKWISQKGSFVPNIVVTVSENKQRQQSNEKQIQSLKETKSSPLQHENTKEQDPTSQKIPDKISGQQQQK